MKREGRNTACQLIFAWSLQSSNNKYLFMRWHYTLQANISGHAVESQGLNQFRAKSRAQKVKSLYICICLNKYIALHIFFYLCIYQSTIYIEKEGERERERKIEPAMLAGKMTRKKTKRMTTTKEDKGEVISASVVVNSSSNFLNIH